MKIYSKYHEESKALKSHIAKIRKNRGELSLDGNMVIYYYGDKLKKGSKIIPYPEKEAFTITSVEIKPSYISYWIKNKGKDFNYLLNSKDKIISI